MEETTGGIVMPSGVTVTVGIDRLLIAPLMFDIVLASVMLLYQDKGFIPSKGVLAFLTLNIKLLMVP